MSARERLPAIPGCNPHLDVLNGRPGAFAATAPRRQVLVLALQFAPVQITGAFRSIGLVKHLPDFGFEPIVLTMNPEDACRLFEARLNPALLKALPDCAQVHYLDRSPQASALPASLRSMRDYVRTDDGIFAMLKAPLISAIEALRDTGRIEAVFVSAPPFGAARLGETAAKMLNVPWILDMRDAWSEWSIVPYRTYLHYRKRYSDEARAFARASAVITVTDRLCDIFRRSHPALPASKFHVVPNGFDGEPIEGGELPHHKPKQTFDVAYVGRYYYAPPQKISLLEPHKWLRYVRGDEDWSYRSPLYFFKAWNQLKSIDPAMAGKIRFHHIGAVPHWLVPMAEACGVREHCTFRGEVARQEITSVLDKMDTLLITSMKRAGSGDYCLASKTFDYLAARRPMLAFVTEGEQRDFLQSSGGAAICDPDDPQHGASQLMRLMNGTLPLSINAEFVNDYSRRSGAEGIGRILSQVIPD
jgi:hypothetical protein